MEGRLNRGWKGMGGWGGGETIGIQLLSSVQRRHSETKLSCPDPLTLPAT